MKQSIFLSTPFSLILILGLLQAASDPVVAQSYDHSNRFLALPPLKNPHSLSETTTRTEAVNIVTEESPSAATVDKIPSTSPTSESAVTSDGATGTTSPTVKGPSPWDLGYKVDQQKLKATVVKSLDPPTAKNRGEVFLKDTIQFHRDLIAWNPDKAVLYTWKSMQIQVFSEPPTLLTMSFAIELSNEDARQEIALNVGRIDESVSRLIQTTPPLLLRTLEGKMRLKRQMTRAINAALTRGAARDVYFTDFCIQ